MPGVNDARDFSRGVGARGVARVRYLDEACAGDPELRAEVDVMIAAHAEAGSSRRRDHQWDLLRAEPQYGELLWRMGVAES